MADEATEEIGTEENAQPERPAYLPSNFNSPEDLAKSYTHLVPKLTEMGQENAALRAEIEEIKAVQAQSAQQTQTADIEQQLYDAYESGDGRAIAAANAFLVQQAVQQQIAELQQPQTQQFPTEFAVEYARDKMARDIPDWNDVEEDVGRIIQGNPVLAQSLAGETNPQKIVESLKTAYKLAKYESGSSASTRAEQELVELNRLNKNQAQTMVGTNSAQEAASYWDQVKEAKAGIPSFRLP